MRPRKPKSVLKLHGTVRKDRHSDRFDDAVMDSELVKPDGLSADASAFWDEIVPQLLANRIGKQLDRAMVISCCQWWGRYCEAQRRLDDPEYADAAPVILNQLMGLASSTWKNFDKAASKLGMSPVDRAKLSADPKPATSDFDKDITKHA